MSDKDTKKQEDFYRNMDFMRLGQAINRSQWQSAAMIMQRMDRNAKEAEITEFERQFAGIRQCINRRNGFEAKQILAIVINKRARYLNERNNKEREN